MNDMNQTKPSAYSVVHNNAEECEDDQYFGFRPYTLYIDGHSAYTIDKYVIGEDALVAAADLTKDDLISIRDSINGILQGWNQRPLEGW